MIVRTRLINRRYRLERRIALSETTESWLGFDNVLHRAVTITLPRQEFLRNGPFLVEFLQRSRIATALHHRGIVAAFDSGEDGDTPYLVTEYLGGEPLSDIILAESPFDIDDVAILVEQVAAALDYAHQRGYLHGKLAADDVIVDAQGVAKLIGLGLPIGTNSIVHDAGQHTATSLHHDVLALGAIAFEMLTGEEPGSVDADSAGETYLIDPDVPRNASDIVAIALGAGAVHFGSASAFASSLSAWRSFDPGEFYVAAKPVIDEAPDEEWIPAVQFPPITDEFTFRTENEAAVIGNRDIFGPRGSGNRTHWLLVATVVLLFAAAAIIWQTSNPASESTLPIPVQLDVVAQLAGF